MLQRDICLTAFIITLGSTFFASLSTISYASPSPCISGPPTVCIIIDPNAPNTFVALTVQAGSIAERLGEHGVAHFLEHLTFRNRSVENGEPTTGAAGIDRYGNAYTTAFATTYHWTVPPNRTGEAVGRALRVLGALDVPNGSVDQERIVVQREREQRLSRANETRSITITAALYEGTPLARPVIGAADEIDALTLEAARAFHERHYHPANAVLVVAGAINSDTIMATVVDARAALPTLLSPDPASTSGSPPPPVGFDPMRLTPLPPHRLVAQGPFGVPERTLDATFVLQDMETSADDEANTRTLAAADLIEAFLNSGLKGSPRVALEKGRGRVPKAVGDDVREAVFTINEIVPGLLYLGGTIGLRPTVKGERIVPSLDAACAAWENEWRALRAQGLPPGAFDRLHARMGSDLSRTRAHGIASAWNLIGCLEADAGPDAWTDYPEAVAMLTEKDVDMVLDMLDAPTRSFVTDALPAPGPVVVETVSRTSNDSVISLPFAPPSD